MPTDKAAIYHDTKRLSRDAKNPSRIGNIASMQRNDTQEKDPYPVYSSLAFFNTHSRAFSLARSSPFSSPILLSTDRSFLNKNLDSQHRPAD